MSTVATLPHHSERESDASLLTIAEVCAELRVSRSTVWRLCRDGELTAFRFGNRTRVLASSVEDMLVRGHVEPILPPWSSRHPSHRNNPRRTQPLPDLPPDSEELQ